MKYFLFICFYLIFPVLSEDYYEKLYERQNSNIDYADWELFESSNVDKKASKLSTTSAPCVVKDDNATDSSSNSCSLAKIMNSLWTHLTDLADDVEKLENELHWESPGDTDDYPESNNHTQELDISEIECPEKCDENSGKNTSKTSSAIPALSTVGTSAKTQSHNTSNSSVNGTDVKQMSNKLEIQKLDKWKDQIKNCKILLKQNPNKTLEDMSLMCCKRKVKEIAIPLRNQRYSRRMSRNGPYSRYLRRRRRNANSSSGTSHKQHAEENKNKHRVYRHLRHSSLRQINKNQPGTNENFKVHNYIY